jgi:hypothetical protein
MLARAALAASLALPPAVMTAGAASAQPATGDSLVSSGSPAGPFSQNKQNEPAVTHDPLDPNVLVAGANDNIDMELCNAGADNTCPFTDGVGVSGVYFSTDRGKTWVQPTYTGLTARGCTGVPGNDPGCTPTTGPIGTLPNYAENGLVSDGDAALAFGPAFANGRPSWSNGSRLYYANLTSALTAGTFKGAEAIAVSHTDDVTGAMAGNKSAWSAPVIASRQNGALFSDKEQIWADNAASSPFFGNVYVCYAAFQGNGNGSIGQSMKVLTSRDGGSTWTQRQVSSSAANPNSRQGFGRSGCTVRTDSRGTAYVFWTQFADAVNTSGAGTIQMIQSTDGGATWSRPVNVTTAYDTCNYVEPSIGRCVEDGVGGARDDLSPAPSVDIANGAPSGADATNQMVLTWVDGRAGLNAEHVLFTSSTNGGRSWTAQQRVERPGDRGYYSAPAISPDAKHVWLVYNAFTTPFRTAAGGAGNDRQLVGVVLHAPVTGGTVGAFTEVHRGVSGDARSSSQNNLAAEFLGDYVYATADRTYGAAPTARPLTPTGRRCTTTPSRPAPSRRMPRSRTVPATASTPASSQPGLRRRPGRRCSRSARRRSATATSTAAPGRTRRSRLIATRGRPGGAPPRLMPRQLRFATDVTRPPTSPGRRRHRVAGDLPGRAGDLALLRRRLLRPAPAERDGGERADRAEPERSQRPARPGPLHAQGPVHREVAGTGVGERHERRDQHGVVLPAALCCPQALVAVDLADRRDHRADQPGCGQRCERAGGEHRAAERLGRPGQVGVGLRRAHLQGHAAAAARRHVSGAAPRQRARSCRARPDRAGTPRTAHAARSPDGDPSAPAPAVQLRAQHARVGSATAPVRRRAPKPSAVEARSKPARSACPSGPRTTAELRVTAWGRRVGLTWPRRPAFPSFREVDQDDHEGRWVDTGRSPQSWAAGAARVALPLAQGPTAPLSVRRGGGTRSAW